MVKKRRIALIMDLVGSYGRSLYAGIAKYGSLIGDWEILSEPSVLWCNIERLWECNVDGAMVFGPWTMAVEKAIQSGLPVVSLSDRSLSSSVFSFQVDHQAVGRLAAEYLLEKGFKTLGYVGWQNQEHSRLRGLGFHSAGQQHATIHSFPYPETARSTDTDGSKLPVWPDPDLVQWLSSLPKPIGVFAANDYRAGDVMLAATELRYIIPDQVAILGADNDEIVQQRLSVPLSSIELPAVRIGYEAAAFLNKVMSGERPAPLSAARFPPLRVIPRQSTDVSTVQDPEVAAAISFIQSHSISRISMEDVASAVSLSSRTLELRFRKAIGQSPGEVLIRSRIKYAQQLLLETDLKTSDIARKAGFCSPSHFGVIFRQYVGMTATEYRQNSRIC